MERAVLVTEAHTPLGSGLVRLLLARNCRVAAAIDSAAQGGEGGWPAEYRAKPFISVPWNRRSPVSAHNLLRSVVDSFGSLDEALVIEPSAPPADIGGCASAEVERAFDDCKGTVFILRELLAHFSAAGGLLCLASLSPRSTDQAGPAVEQAARESFRGLASSLLASHTSGPLIVNAFQGWAAEAEEFAVFIDRTLEEKARKITGRWFTCQPRAGAGKSRPERLSPS